MIWVGILFIVLFNLDLSLYSLILGVLMNLVCIFGLVIVVNNYKGIWLYMLGLVLGMFVGVIVYIVVCLKEEDFFCFLVCVFYCWNVLVILGIGILLIVYN